ncbi:MAG: PadR family transcriptional regulator [Erysipelotrichaceae bacterium]|nr:PadR family transcriptional regulator [Erysipelotrichaceae bacterium]
MISSDVIRGYTDLMILSILAKGDSYGYQLSKQIEAISDGKYSIKETTLYSAIARLEKNDHVTSYKGEGSGGTGRTYYSITLLGETYLKEKEEEWELTKEVINRFSNREGK